jgi:VWFA-related protein
MKALATNGRRSAVALGLSLATVQAGALPPSPPQEPPQFGATTELVLIDLIATDKDGRLVTDLRPDEVEVYEDGKKQTVDFVRLVLSGRQAASPPSPSAEAPPGQPEPVNGPTAKASLVVVVDLRTMTQDVLARTREAILATAREEQEDGTRLMLVAIDRAMEVRLPFTDDLAPFVAAVKMLPTPIGEGEAAMATLIDDLDQGCDNSPGSVQNAITLAKAWVDDARLGLASSTEGLSALARYLAPLPGRKHIVFYSAGYPMDPSALATTLVTGICTRPDDRQAAADVQTSLRAGPQVDSAGLLHALLDQANRAQVSVYTVDARGLVGDSVPTRSRAPTRLSRGGGTQEVARRNVRAPQDILFSMAEGTGATAWLNTNELTRGMRAAAADAHGYYLVAYAPPSGRKEGRFYSIDVKVTRPGLRVRHRRGYEWLSEAKRNERALTSALQFPNLYADPGLGLEPTLAGRHLKVAVMVPTAALTFRKVGGQNRNEIILQALLRDEKGKVPGKSLTTKTVTLKLTDERYADLRSRDNVEIPLDMEAPPRGRYHLTVVACHSNGRLDAAVLDLDVP